MLIAVMVAVTFLNFNSNEVTVLLTGGSFTIPPVLFVLHILIPFPVQNIRCANGFFRLPDRAGA